MIDKIRAHKFYPVLLFVFLLTLLVVTATYAANIDITDKWAYGINTGWLNFAPTHGSGMTVYDDHIEGYAWGENIGWIRLGTHEGGGAHTYLNTAADNYGVNHDGNGVLSGYAWGTNVGWINLNPTHGGVTIDTATGSFDGYAWGENIGWIHFKNTTGNAYNVVTTWRLVGAGAGDKKIFNIGAAGGTFRFDPVRVFIPEGTMEADCQLVIRETASGSFKLGNQVYDIKIICGGQSVTQFSKMIQVCVRPRDGVTAGKQIFHQPTGTHGFNPLLPSIYPVPAGYVCGDTSRLSLFALGKLQLPNTGFTPGMITTIPEQLSKEAYTAYEGFWLEIPSLGVEMPIVGVPLTEKGWDVTWLGDQAGYLQGTAYR